MQESICMHVYLKCCKVSGASHRLVHRLLCFVTLRIGGKVGQTWTRPSSKLSHLRDIHCSVSSITTIKKKSFLPRMLRAFLIYWNGSLELKLSFPWQAAFKSQRERSAPFSFSCPLLINKMAILKKAACQSPAAGQTRMIWGRKNVKRSDPGSLVPCPSQDIKIWWNKGKKENFFFCLWEGERTLLHTVCRCHRVTKQMTRLTHDSRVHSEQQPRE